MNSARFETLQATLGIALEANRPHSGVDHVLIALPSYSVGESLLSHYADRIPALEHRYLLSSLLVGRVESCEVVFVTCEEPQPEVLAYYSSMILPKAGIDSWERFRLLIVPDRSSGSIAAKLLDRPDLMEQLRKIMAGRPAFIEPWNVTDAEVEVSCQLGAALNGTSPALRPLAFKSAGRRLFSRVGVPCPIGVEGVRSIDDVLDAINVIRDVRPGLRAVVVKHDDSGAGDGNAVIDLITPSSDGLRSRVKNLPGWYLDDLERDGGVVEELVTGDWFSSPSAQIDIEPSGDVVALATHEQVLGGDNGQVYMGCRFPADQAYAAQIADHAITVGKQLAQQGALGRVAIDFVAARDALGDWSVYALEMNLRKGGTTHPYTALRNLVPGRYDVRAARWITADGSHRCYRSSDNVVDARWEGRAPASVIGAIAKAGLEFDHTTGTGVVLHMLSGLAIDGRFGMTAIGHTAQHADGIYQDALTAVATTND
ncbi:MAG: peptide ligase PGM1-related protein [Actinomycetota bacterium]